MDEVNFGGKMTGKILIALRETAKNAGITPAQAKYWVHLLGVFLVMKGRTGFLGAEDSQKITKMAGLVSGGLSPKEAALEISGVVHENALVPENSERSGNGFEILEGKITGLEQQNVMIEKALMLLVEENKALRGEVSRLADSNNALRVQLMPPQEPVKPVIPWKPEPAKDPLEGMSWFQKTYVKVFEPQKLRRYDS